MIVAWGIAPGFQFAQKEALKARFMPRLIFNPRYDARQNHMMIEPASRVNRAFSAGDFGISRILGRCPRLEMTGAPLALNICL
jgi:hypothetical protein